MSSLSSLLRSGYAPQQCIQVLPPLRFGLGALTVSLSAPALINPCDNLNLDASATVDASSRGLIFSWAGEVKLASCSCQCICARACLRVCICLLC